jgi:hypothetical protein
VGEHGVNDAMLAGIELARCTTRDSRLTLKRNPLFSNTFSIEVLSGKISAINS